MDYRYAGANDATQIAELHADSWRRHYRGAYTDEYLDGDVVADRLAVWTARLAEPEPNHFTVVAVHHGEVVGFAHTVIDDDSMWGALLDNLHVTYPMKGSGIGTRLLGETARGVVERAPASNLYLWVLEQNTAAQAFYADRGGKVIERKVGGPFPGGGTAAVLRVAWADPSILCD